MEIWKIAKILQISKFQKKIILKNRNLKKKTL